MNDASPIGAVQEISGEVTVIRTNGIVESASIGTPIYQGDVIETNESGAVNILFMDETTFAISEDARLAIDEYVFDPATQSGTSNFSVLKGVFVFTSGLIGRDDPDDVEIDTPSGSIGIRGTIIAGDVDSGEITVIEGAIVLRDFSGNSVTLANQYETAKFMPSSNSIEYMGELAANDVATKFTSVSNVSGTLFSSIQDTANENQEITPNTVPEAQEPESQASDDNADDSSGEDTQGDQGTVEGSSDDSSTNTENSEETNIEAEQTAQTIEPMMDDMMTSSDIMGKDMMGENNTEGSNASSNTAPSGTNTESAATADGTVTSDPMDMPTANSDPVPAFSVTVTRPDIPENNTGVIEIAVIKGHFTSHMTLQLNGLSQSYYDVIRIDATSFSIQTKPGIIMGNMSYHLLDFTAVNTYGETTISKTIDLNMIDDIEGVTFIADAPNDTSGGETDNLFKAADFTNWGYDFSQEFDDPDGQIAYYTYSGNIGTAPVSSINMTASGQMFIDFADVDGSSYNLIVEARDSLGNILATTSNYTFQTDDTTTTSMTAYFGGGEVGVLSGPQPAVYIASANNTIFTQGGDDGVSIAGMDDNFVNTGTGDDDIQYDGGVGNSVFAGYGQDDITITATGLTNLASSNSYFDGGHGNDRLIFNSGGNIDFTAIPDTYLHNFETLSTVQGTAQTNTITLSRTDVIEMTDSNNQLVIEMDNLDTLNFVNDAGTTFINQGQTTDGLFDIYTDTTITLLVSTQGTVSPAGDLP